MIDSLSDRVLHYRTMADEALPGIVARVQRESTQAYYQRAASTLCKGLFLALSLSAFCSLLRSLSFVFACLN